MTIMIETIVDEWQRYCLGASERHRCLAASSFFEVKSIDPPSRA